MAEKHAPTEADLLTARQTLLAAFPRLRTGGDKVKAIQVLTFEPMCMRDIVAKGELKDTCYVFLNECAERGLINRPARGRFCLKRPGEPLGEPPDVPAEDPDETLFPLESHLRDFLAKNIGAIKPHGRTLRLYRDPQDPRPPSSRDGTEYPTDVGLIDILAEDSNGSLVVFELKLSRGPDRAVGQLLRYMGWVRKYLARGKDVLGVLVAREIDDKLKYAASAAANISIFEYEVTFNLCPVSPE